MRITAYYTATTSDEIRRMKLKTLSLRGLIDDRVEDETRLI